MIRIVVESGKDVFTFDYEGDAPLKIGRLPSLDLPINHTDVSREHCSILPDGPGAWKVRDHASRNGIIVNGARTAECTLSPGAVIQLAPDVKLTFGEDPAAPKEKVVEKTA